MLVLISKILEGVATGGAPALDAGVLVLISKILEGVADGATRTEVELGPPPIVPTVIEHTMLTTEPTIQ